MTPRRTIGPVERQVRKDLSRLPDDDSGNVTMRGTLKIQAQHIASAIDAYSVEQAGNSARLAALAKCHQELRQIMRGLTASISTDDPVKRLVDGMSTALRDSEKS